MNVGPLLGGVEMAAGSLPDRFYRNLHAADSTVIRARYARMVFDLPRVEWFSDAEWRELDRAWEAVIDRSAEEETFVAR